MDPAAIINKTKNFNVRYNTVKVNIAMDFIQAPGFVPYQPVPMCFIFSITNNAGQEVYYVEAADTEYGHSSQYRYEYLRTDEIELPPGSYTAKLTHRGRWLEFYNLGVGHVGTCSINFTETAPTMASNYSLFKPEIKYQYNNKGILVETKPAGSNIATAYLWGYNYQYPIAEIENATYNQVKDALTETVINRIANTNTLSSSDSTLLNNLRSNTLLKGSQITTYTYQPLIGMQTMTNPRGFTTYFDYDPFGRLIETYYMENGAKKRIETHDYHYKNQ